MVRSLFMEDKEQYKALMSEVIQKQSIILGPEMAIARARGVSGLSVSDDGKVTDIQDDPQTILERLVDQYVELSGLIVKNALGSIFLKYPTIKKVE